MVVFVQFLGLHRMLTGIEQVEVPISENGRVRDVFDHIRNSFPKMALEERDVLVTVNKEPATMEQALHPDDHVSFLPHIGGG